MKHILAVYDVDPVYAARFAEVVNQKEKIPFELDRAAAGICGGISGKASVVGRACSGGRKGVHPGGKGYSFIG